MSPSKHMKRITSAIISITLTTATISTAVEIHPSAPHPADHADQVTGLTGDWNGTRNQLAAMGITPYATLLTEVFANVDGGFKDGVTAPILLDFGVELDLEKLLGWKGGAFTATAFLAYGEDGSARNTGDFNVASNIFTDTDFNVFDLFFSQTFADEKIFLKAGQITLDDDFMNTETGSLFLNSAFAPMPTQSGNTAAPIFPLTAPGVFGRVQLTDNLNIQVATYSGNAGDSTSDNHGFKWRTGGAAGWTTFAEINYQHHSTALKLGGFYASGEFTDFNTGLTDTGLSSAYAAVDHTFIDGSNGGVGLNGFARVSFAGSESKVTVSSYYEAGVILSNILKPGDALGCAISHTEFGNDYLRATPNVTSSETALELTYQIPVNDWWILQPDIQWIQNAHEAQNDALVIGLRTEIIF